MAPGFLSALISITTASHYNLHITNNRILLQYPSSKSYKILGDQAFNYLYSSSYGMPFSWT